MKQQDMIGAFARARKDTELFVNKHAESLFVNRMKKIARHPGRVTRVMLYRLGLGKADVSVDMFFGKKIILPLWDEDAMLSYYTGSFGLAETGLVSYLVRNLSDKDVLYDVGANLGLYSALGESLGAQVHAFEPNPRTTPYMVRNAGASTTVNQAALSAEAGRVVLYETALGQKTGMASLFPDMVPKNDAAKPREFTVPAITLDSYAEHHAPPTLVKIDVMNADALVLTGARGVISQYAPLLALRLYHTPSAKERSQETLSLLKEYGYTSFVIQEDGVLVEQQIELESHKFARTYIFKRT